MKTIVINNSENYNQMLSTIVDDIDRVDNIYIENGVVYITDIYYNESFILGIIDKDIYNLIISGNLRIKSWRIIGDVDNNINLALELNFV